MPSSVEADVDPEEKRGTLSPTNEEGGKEGTRMDLAPEAVKLGKKLESSSSNNQVRGAGAEKTTNRHIDAVDTDDTSTCPKKNAGVQIAPSKRKQKGASSRRNDGYRNDTCRAEKRRDDRYRHSYRRNNEQGRFNNHARFRAPSSSSTPYKDPTEVNTAKANPMFPSRKGPPLEAAALLRNMDSDFGSDYESEHATGRDKSLEEAQNRCPHGKKWCKLNELKSPEEGMENEKQEGEYQEPSEIDAGIVTEKIPCPNTYAPSTFPVADTDGTSILPKSSLAINEELMQKKGLPLKMAIDPSVSRKKVSLMIANPQQTNESQARPNFANQAQSQVKLMV